MKNKDVIGQVEIWGALVAQEYNSLMRDTMYAYVCVCVGGRMFTDFEFKKSS